MINTAFSVGNAVVFVEGEWFHNDGDKLTYDVTITCGEREYTFVSLTPATAKHIHDMIEYIESDHFHEAHFEPAGISTIPMDDCERIAKAVTDCARRERPSCTASELYRGI